MLTCPAPSPAQSDAVYVFQLGLHHDIALWTTTEAEVRVLLLLRAPTSCQPASLLLRARVVHQL